MEPNYELFPETFPLDWASDWGEDRYGLWMAFTYRGVRQSFRWILPGRFMMGSPETEADRDDDERLHEVVLSQGFWLGETVCTQALWQAVMGENPSKFKGAQRPVENVSWEDVQTFIERFNSERQGLDLRLPTEAEWEYACRAGTDSPFWFGENITPEQVNYNGNYPYVGGEKGLYRRETVEVKTLPGNGWGFYEMHGNVWEWCSDRFGEYPTETVVDPTGPSRGAERVLRGGSWVYGGRHAQSAVRGWLDPGARYGYIGFRLAQGQQAGEHKQERSRGVTGMLAG